MTDVEVGKIIRFHRKRLGLTQQELARRIGVTWEMISRYERGRSSSIQKLLSIATELEISPSLLLQQPSNGFANDTTVAYSVDKFVPIVKSIPREYARLRSEVELSGEGKKVPLERQVKSSQVFLLEISETVKLRIDVPYIFQKGYFLCSFAAVDLLTEDDIVIANMKEVMTLTKYVPGMDVVVKVLQWVMPL
jgi:transcriptional regulator with XRE-family HTH domain